jgi:putative exporter of polyketide antibiotics
MHPTYSRSAGYKVLTVLIACVWIVNGLICKLLGLVPRHREIVARILGGQDAELLTKLIGFAEIGMALWVMSGIASRTNAVTQMTIIALMNILEFFMAPDLLLWGRWNAFFALLFILLIYYKEFRLRDS